MAKPTREQQRLVKAADPQTGLLRGTPGQMQALVAGGWAFRHPKPPRRCYLTPVGWRLREQLLEPPPAPAGPAAEAPGQPGVFAARTGDETEPGDHGCGRDQEVRSAWEGLLQLRRMTNRAGETDIPCPWERAHLLSAAALALEAAGCAPSAIGVSGERTERGYRVVAWPQADAVRVEWAWPAREPAATGRARLEEELDRLSRALERAGWQVSEHQAARSGARFLLASPRRVPPVGPR
ncbi:hypothetical protein [Streptomyces sp. 8N706]|uniref:hypothetical protein n=1 Tax=Streptomyces sp. 8N706 TaxID=3457416 RepID=UPI003FD5239A